MHLIFVRHGETDWNTVHLLQGHTDIPLNEKGREQAEQTAESLRGIRFDRIVASPLLRAKETAEIINRDRQVPLFCDARIRERGFGDLEGTVIGQAEFNTWWKSTFDADAVHVEPTAHLLERVYSLIDELKAKYPNDTVLMVSHGGTYVAVCSYFYGYPADRETLYFISNCSHYEFPEI